jgi:hypothetical protein
VGKVRSSVSQVNAAALPREKTITVVIRVRAGRLFAGRSKNHIQSRVSAESCVGLKVGWGERGAGHLTHSLLHCTREMVGQSQTTSSKVKRGIVGAMNY